MSQAPGNVEQTHSVQDAMRITEEQVEIEAGKLNADGSPKDPAGTKADTETTAAAGGAGADDKPTGVLTADGKHIMPYSVVTGAREAAANAEQRARQESEARQRAEDAARQLTAEVERLKAGKAGSEVDAAATDDNLKTLREQADAIRENLPAMAEMFDTLIKEVEGTRERLATHDKNETERRTNAESEMNAAVTEVNARIRTAIDNNPTLAAWEVENVDAFNKACDFDAVLKGDPRWKGKTFDQRFEQAVKLTLVDMPDAKVIAPKKDAPQETEAEIAARAKKVLDAAGHPQVDGLSDLPGGAAPGGNPLENLEAVPAHVLANRMESMTTAQLEAFILKHG